LGRRPDTTMERIKKFVMRQEYGAVPFTIDRRVERNSTSSVRKKKPRKQRKAGANQTLPIVGKKKKGTGYIRVAGHKVRVPAKEVVLSAAKKALADEKGHVVVSPSCGYCNMQKDHLAGKIPFKNKEGNVQFKTPDPKNEKEMKKALPAGFDKKFVHYHNYLGDETDLLKDPLGHLPKNEKGQYIDTAGRVIYDPTTGEFNKKTLEDALVEARVTQEIMDLYGIDGFPTFLYNPKTCDPSSQRCFDSGLKGKESVIEFFEKNTPVQLRDIERDAKKEHKKTVKIEHAGQMENLKEIIGIVGEEDFKKVARMNSKASNREEIEKNMLSVFGKEKFDRVVSILNRS